MKGRPKYVSFFVTDNKKTRIKFYAEIDLSQKDDVLCLIKAMHAACEKLAESIEE